MRRPMEEVYGAELFIKTWEGWVDGIGQFAQRPEGKGSNIFAAKIPIFQFHLSVPVLGSICIDP